MACGPYQINNLKGLSDRTFNAGSLCMGAPNGTHHAIFQTDGNFVVYNSLGRATWSSRTSSIASGGTFAVQGDGNIVIYNSAHHAVWSTGTFFNSSYRYIELDIQSDGKLVAYMSNPAAFRAFWASGTNGQ
jgi:hypothetical protein